MPLGERNTRPGFQVALKRERTSFIGKFDDDVDNPRPILRSVGTAARVVFGMPCLHIGGNAGVVPRRLLVVPDMYTNRFAIPVCSAKRLPWGNDAKSTDFKGRDCLTRENRQLRLSREVGLPTVAR